MLRFSPAGDDRPLRLALIGAHCDDVEIGCGGMVLDLAARGALASADALVLASVPAREEETRKALPAFTAPAPCEVTFGGLPDGRLPAHWDRVKDLMQEFAARVRPDVVLAPSPADAHQDHRLLGRLVRTVWRDALVLHYEIPKWDGDSRSPDVYVPLDEGHARRKVELLHRCFPSQAERDWWDDEFFSGVMRLRGVESRARYAEGFMCRKLLLDPGAGSAG